LLLLGILAVSWLDALIGRRRAILLSYSLTVAGIGMLWLVRPYPSVWLLYGFLLCFGGTIGSRGPLVTAAAMSIFRGKNIGTIFGTISIGSGLGAALGSWAGGLIHDWSGGYDLVIAFTLASVLVGMIAFLLVPTLRN
jgi:MFS family permease